MRACSGVAPAASRAARRSGYPRSMIEEVHLANPRGFCAGVDRAIEAVEDAARENVESGRGDLAVYHAIVHNDTVVGRLEAEHGVHFVEDLGGVDGDFPTGAALRQFGPAEGDRVAIRHGKPDGRCFSLGRGEVTECLRDEGKVTVRREMSGGGMYDALEVPRESGDVAVTKFREGRWWYPTAYRSSDGETKGTYVNVCTPVELFPDSARYVDLHVDVVRFPDGEVRRVDDDELDESVAAGEVSEELAEKARSVASSVEKALR
ncbi:MAG: DUF402 domain-containing protein [Thiohalospira sp.]